MGIKQGLYIQKGKRDRIKKWTDLLEEGKRKMREWKQGNLFGMPYISRKERQTNGNLFEKTLNLQKVNNVVEQKEGLWAYTTILFIF